MTTRIWSQAEKELIYMMHKRSFTPEMIAQRIGKCTKEQVEFLILDQNKPLIPVEASAMPSTPLDRGQPLDPIQVLLGQLIRQHNDQTATLKSLAVIFSHIPQQVEYAILVQRIEAEWTKLPVTAARPPLHIHMFEMLSRMFIFIPRPLLEKKPTPDA